ncbi:hypothetical protein DM860_014744 [Cuscuta australis]|uniref:DUF789 domain-containing protein n=1 Tax=Cuscuta australis TaxID=267555 RepID=A0A328DII3_9ASTE|nr:hypothetical protein DM860_014744 [Cuscuta australis]
MDRSSMQSNLEWFLNCTTPIPKSQFLPKSETGSLNRLWHPVEREGCEYFTLADLWSCYDEWSVYGAGVPLCLDNGETIVQYFVPYLSALQIFTSSASLNSLNCLREESVSSCETRDSYSDSLSEESESDKLSRWDGSSSEEGNPEHDSLLQANSRLGYLYFQYFERSTPYGRVPLMDMISGLAQRYPGLMSLRSVDLSPASWMAVAWYPIYHIPMGKTSKDLSTCFLTFHTISSSFQGAEVEGDLKSVSRNPKGRGGGGVPLPPFGLASYKMQGDVWVSDKSGKDQERVVSLLSVADSWLKQLGVQHHDFNYFVGIRGG